MTVAKKTRGLRESEARSRSVAEHVRVLIVDGVEKQTRETANLLWKVGLSPRTATSASEALLALHDAPADVVLIDLDSQAGWQLLEVLGKQLPEVALLCSGLGMQWAERIRAFDLGADGFLPRPLQASELVAQTRAVLRRYWTLPILQFENLRIDVGRRLVFTEAQRVELSPREFDTLRVLVESRGEPVSKADLLHEVWGLAGDPGTLVVEVLVSRLRRRLTSAGGPPIPNDPARGYSIGSD